MTFIDGHIRVSRYEKSLNTFINRTIMVAAAQADEWG